MFLLLRALNNLRARYDLRTLYDLQVNAYFMKTFFLMEKLKSDLIKHCKKHMVRVTTYQL